jgi:uncharacterized OB-fold protein
MWPYIRLVAVNPACFLAISDSRCTSTSRGNRCSSSTRRTIAIPRREGSSYSGFCFPRNCAVPSKGQRTILLRRKRPPRHCECRADGVMRWRRVRLRRVVDTYAAVVLTGNRTKLGPANSKAILGGLLIFRPRSLATAHCLHGSQEPPTEADQGPSPPPPGYVILTSLKTRIRDGFSTRRDQSVRIATNLLRAGSASQLVLASVKIDMGSSTLSWFNCHGRTSDDRQDRGLHVVAQFRPRLDDGPGNPRRYAKSGPRGPG